MLFIDNGETFDPRMNLAIEEYAALHLSMEESYLLFYINQPSIIIGKNQNTFEEINSEYVRDHNIYVVRRLSGGGAVYHDFGNLNFSFITKNDGDAFRNFRRFTEPVIKALNDLGVPAELTGRNDIQVGEQKISGNAQFATKGRMFSHGTLMFNVQLDNVAKALQVKADKIASKGIKSVRSRVANISEFLKQPMTIEAFRQHLLESIFGGGEIPQYRLQESDWAKIEEISNERYRNWDWNYGKSPTFDVQKSHRFPIGSIDVRMNVNKGLITDCKIYGDFFGVGEVDELAQRFVGKPLRYDDLQEVIADVDIRPYFGDISHAEFLSLFA